MSHNLLFVVVCSIVFLKEMLYLSPEDLSSYHLDD